MGTKKTHAIGFRLPQSLKEIIGRIAERETRSISQQVEHFVRRGIDDYEKNHPDFDPEQKTNNG